MLPPGALGDQTFQSVAIQVSFAPCRPAAVPLWCNFATSSLTNLSCSAGQGFNFVFEAKINPPMEILMCVKAVLRIVTFEQNLTLLPWKFLEPQWKFFLPQWKFWLPWWKFCVPQYNLENLSNEPKRVWILRTPFWVELVIKRVCIFFVLQSRSLKRFCFLWNFPCCLYNRTLFPFPRRGDWLVDSFAEISLSSLPSSSLLLSFSFFIICFQLPQTCFIFIVFFWTFFEVNW